MSLTLLKENLIKSLTFLVEDYTQGSLKLKSELHQYLPTFSRRPAGVDSTSAGDHRNSHSNNGSDRVLWFSKSLVRSIL
jgi:hypothetical protein